MATKLIKLPAAPGLKKAVVKDAKSAGTNGGTFTAGSFITRDLNTVEGDTDIVSVSSNQFTLQPGTYLIYGETPAKDVDKHKCQIYDVTGSATLSEGTSSASRDDYPILACPSFFSARVVLTSANTYEIRHRCEKTKITDGLGLAVSFAAEEVYTVVRIIQLAGA